MNYNDSTMTAITNGCAHITAITTTMFSGMQPKYDISLALLHMSLPLQYVQLHLLAGMYG